MDKILKGSEPRSAAFDTVDTYGAFDTEGQRSGEMPEKNHNTIFPYPPYSSLFSVASVSSALLSSLLLNKPLLDRTVKEG